MEYVNINLTANFATVIKNVEAINREARHIDLAKSVYDFVKMIEKFLGQVEYQAMFMESPQDGNYIYSNVLDFMDSLKDAMELVNKNTNEYKVLNSVYDVLREFYFGE